MPKITVADYRDQIFRSADPNLFRLSREEVMNLDTKSVRSRVKAFIANPLTEPKFLKVRPVLEETREPVEIYFQKHPKKGHVFEIIEDGCVEFEAIRLYNRKHKNNPIEIRFSITDLRGNGETETDVKTQRMVNRPKPASLRLTTEMLATGTRFDTAQNQVMIYNDYRILSRRVTQIIKGNTKYSNSVVKVILILNGKESKTDLRDYNLGHAQAPNPIYNNDIISIATFLRDLNQHTQGAISITGVLMTYFARFYRKKVYRQNTPIDLNRIIRYLDFLSQGNRQGDPQRFSYLIKSFNESERIRDVEDLYDYMVNDQQFFVV